jgi:hypothetical protein
MVHSQLGLKSEGSQLSDAEQAIEGEKDGLSPESAFHCLG